MIIFNLILERSKLNKELPGINMKFLEVKTS